MTILLPLLAFVFASLLVAAGAMMLAPGRAATIERLLGELTGHRTLEASGQVSQRLFDTMNGGDGEAPTAARSGWIP